MATYITRQHRALLACFESRGGCVTATELLDALRAEGERVGLTTVYRQLERLEKQGHIHKVVTEEGAYYQYCEHEEDGGCFLLKCERCGRIEHVGCERLAPLYAHLEQEHHFRINPARTMLYGVCAACQEGDGCGE